jgi:hypothetical protein
MFVVSRIYIDVRNCGDWSVGKEKGIVDGMSFASLPMC